MIACHKFFQALLVEPWLAFNRQLTFYVLQWLLRKRVQSVQYVPDATNILYVAASALPFHMSGYTTRSHEVIRAMGLAGANVHVMTRPGYPWDRKDRQQDAVGVQTVVDGVCYHHASTPANNRPVLQYVSQATRVVAEIALRQRVAVIHAASNHVNALPALLAARQLGIPFQYEMRGLWELTRISRMPAYEHTQAFKQGLQLEGLVARHADRLFVISEQLGNFVHETWGVANECMSLLPNCVDPERIVPAELKHTEVNTIGYAGSLIGYEGLDTLIDAVDVLVRSGHPVAVNIIGDGEARSELETRVHLLGLAEQIHFHGKLTPHAARELLGCCELVCIPRKSFEVCEIVPPIKLVEALALGKPVIVPDLPVFRDELGTDPAGWFFRSGDAFDLARVIRMALADRGVLAALGQRARTYAATQRNWRDFVINVLPLAQVGG